MSVSMDGTKQIVQSSADLVKTAPQFSLDDATQIAREQYGVEGIATSLTSERDQNFCIETKSGNRSVLKIANSREPETMLDLENRVMERLGENLKGIAAPRCLANRDGKLIGSVAGPSGGRHFVRMVSHLPGVRLSDLRRHSPELLRSLGSAIASVDQALAGFSHPALPREFHWDLLCAEQMLAMTSNIGDSRRRGLVERHLSHFVENIVPRMKLLPAQVIHNDANDSNVLVERDSEGEWHVTGLVDFGDMVMGTAICDLAVAATYVGLQKPDPIAAFAEVIRDYNSVRALTEIELRILLDVILARMCFSVTLSAFQHRLSPENEYLLISEKPMWEAIESLCAMPKEWAEYRFRHACGLAPCPQTESITRWLGANQKSFASVVKPDPQEARLRVLDLSAGSLELPSAIDPADAIAFTKWMFDEIYRGESEIGIGRYAEPRLCYRAEQFSVRGNDGPEARTVHIGLDLFQEAGSPIFAPLAGVVHSFADNVKPLDYGPTIILQHDAGGIPFYTLYGHLSRTSLEGLREGIRIERGQKIATMGDATENGGWPPHLHFQIITDMLGRRGDFPGVAAPSEREIWQSVSPDPTLIVQIPNEQFPAPRKSSDEILKARREHLGPSLSLSYNKPLHLVRGFRQHVWDADGRIYLDAINNVPHVGHCHPRVVEAIARQSALLATNTRYLYDVMAEYTERLTATLPAPLRVCYLTNSGSEANELALRLARAYTKRKDVLVLDVAYHGNTSALIEISPYKFSGNGGEGKPAHIHVAPIPNAYRGPWKTTDPSAGLQFAKQGAEEIQKAERDGRKIGAFIHESLPASGGMIVPPAGCLKEMYAHTRKAGAICIADEVQVGFGRAGSHMWAFELQGVVPDIVTMGKPIGNGFPMGAVVTTPEIAQAFANGMEYFNTFGGNPVACAAGLAVLDVMRDERLMENARNVGEQLLFGLRALQQKHAIIGDVRGSGFFIGVELVRDRKSLEHASSEANWIAERLKERGILIATEGPHHNVLKIRPPMCFSSQDAEQLLAALNEELSELSQFS
ncbi:MAG: aminotransferase class III-fold pyridoxal phosphate-dependent enzyme [Acidobacteria bacterium]|nr:aminotransferase class III-fold pyridoxal phosphate-dependent enzyme [Acidobacteriota bacterium]